MREVMFVVGYGLAGVVLAVLFLLTWGMMV
jgi:hypothetical protein